MILEGDDLHRREGGFEIVRGVSLAVGRGEWVALVGPSGSGKTTLLQMLGLLDRPTAGTVRLDGEDAWARPSGRRARLRRERLGFVFQQGNLLEHLSARDNVALPAWRRTGSRARALARADELLDGFGLGARRHARASVLSAGEAQRVAIARALVNDPAVVLADEPTGSLDSATATVVLDALATVVARGAALLVVTHDADVATRAARTLHLRDGALAP